MNLLGLQLNAEQIDLRKFPFVKTRLVVLNDFLEIRVALLVEAACDLSGQCLPVCVAHAETDFATDLL